MLSRKGTRGGAGCRAEMGVVMFLGGRSVTTADSERERRSRMWAGLHAEYLDHDVQH
jgi:hypothetical protein